VHWANPAENGASNVLHGRVAGITFQGSVIECDLDLGGVRLRALAHPSADLAAGVAIAVQVDPSRCTVFRREVEQ
jgi:hypothetical protein